MGTSSPLLDFTVPEYDPTVIEYYIDDDAIPCFKNNVKDLVSKFLPSVYSLVFIVGLLGNAAVVLILTKYKRLTSMTNIYLFNLAISDLLFLVTIPFWIHYVKQNDWVFGDIMCKLLTGLHYLGLYSEIFFIILLTIDRYVAIVHAVFAIRVRRVVLSITTSIITWVVALLVSLPDIIFTKSQREFTHYTCSLHFPHETSRLWIKFQALKLNFLGLILPLWVMIVCYTGIIKILLKRRNERKWKVVKVIFAIMIIFFLFWTPYNVTVLISAFDEFIFTSNCEKSKQLDLAIQVTEIIAFTHCCVNPVIYAFIGERFQKYLSHFVRNHIAVHLCRHIPSFLKDRLEQPSSNSPPTGEHEFSDEF